MNASRLIAATHRVKQTAAGEAHPTLLTIIEAGKRRTFELETEQDELDFVNGEWPEKYRKAEPNEDPSKFRYWHLHWRSEQGKKSENYTGRQKHEDDTLIRVPAQYNGLRAGDTVIMTLGGSGDRFAAAMARMLIQIGQGSVCRVAGHAVKAMADKIGDEPKQNDVLFALWETASNRFYTIDEPEISRIRVREAYENRREAQLARVGCAQRLRQRGVGKVYLSGNLAQEIALEDSYESIRANSVILANLIAEEKEADRLLEKAVKESHVWQVFEPIPGVGPAIAGALIASVGDIRRFETYQKFFAFAGLHPLNQNGEKFRKGEVRTAGDAIFPRRRRDQLSNWTQMSKQALFLLGDQFNRQIKKDTYWGWKLRQNKIALRLAHEPTVVEVRNKKTGKMELKQRYNDGHIQKMALWKTIRQFARWLHRAWTNLENGKPVVFPTIPAEISAGDAAADESAAA